MNRSELVMRRRNVRAFIDADPSDVLLHRITRVATDAGSWTETDPLPLSSLQRVRIMDAKRRYTDPHVNTEAGAIPLSPYIMIGSSTMDIQVDDSFTWLGDHFKVTSIHPDREERTVASIDYFGKTP